MIDWKEVADLNGLTQDEFNKEILTTAACVGAAMIDKKGDGNHVKLTCSDEKSSIEVWVRRTDSIS